MSEKHPILGMIVGVVLVLVSFVLLALTRLGGQVAEAAWYLAISEAVLVCAYAIFSEVRRRTSHEGSVQAGQSEAEGSVPRPANKRRPALERVTAIVIFAMMVVAVILGGHYLNSTAPQTWSQWGMTINHPPVKYTYLYGLYGTSADSNSGLAWWAWNDNDSDFILLWSNATSYDYSVGFAGLQSDFSTNYVNVTLIALGNVTIDGHTWPYQTWSAYSSSTQVHEYTTAALCFYQGEQRLYELEYVDTNPNTLGSLMTYANTFRG